MTTLKERLKIMLESYKKHYWNNYWNKTNVYYSARPDWLNGHTISMILKLDSAKSEAEMKTFFLNATKDATFKNDDSKALFAFTWVRGNIKYIGDFKKSKDYELWQTAFETFNDRTGDCEDGAILMYKICRILGVPAWRLKLRTSQVKYNSKVSGHCYLCYLTIGNNQWSDEWYSLDWCYLPATSLRNFKNKPIRKVEMYNPPEQYKSTNPLKWSFNEEFEWSQKDWKLDFKRRIVEVDDIEI